MREVNFHLDGLWYVVPVRLRRRAGQAHQAAPVLRPQVAAPGQVLAWRLLRQATRRGDGCATATSSPAWARAREAQATAQRRHVLLVAAPTAGLLPAHPWRKGSQVTGTGPTVKRTVFSTPRSGEFLELRALQAQTGQHAEAFGHVVVKELLDNALDAAETASRAPVIEIATRTDDTARSRSSP